MPPKTKGGNREKGHDHKQKNNHDHKPKKKKRLSEAERLKRAERAETRAKQVLQEMHEAAKARQEKREKTMGLNKKDYHKCNDMASDMLQLPISDEDVPMEVVISKDLQKVETKVETKAELMGSDKAATLIIGKILQKEGGMYNVQVNDDNASIHVAFKLWSMDIKISTVHIDATVKTSAATQIKAMVKKTSPKEETEP